MFVSQIKILEQILMSGIFSREKGTIGWKFPFISTKICYFCRHLNETTRLFGDCVVYQADGGGWLFQKTKRKVEGN